uniref:Ubiquitin carboxyl-terminal hydrolase n=1 Tax=Parascaris univalens TaxID=6257 RepID=A0A915C4S7_PARUN
MATEITEETTENNEKSECLSNAYHVKWINFHGIMYGIVTQNENGPCPLVAVANVLLLKGQLGLPNKAERISEKDLLQCIADCLLRLKPEGLNEGDALNYEQNISDVLSLVPSLPRGLDVNVQFNGVNKFEYTTACAFFDLLGIPLLHGWVADPQQKELVRLLGSLGYNEVAERIVNGDQDTESCILADFLQSTASQLTVYGLFELNAALNDGQIAVLFRNNHFHTLYKHKDGLFVLVADQGFINEPSVVWETLNSVDGSSVFVDASFNESRPADAKETSDHLLALALQEEESRREEEANAMSRSIPTAPSSSTSSEGFITSEASTPSIAKRFNKPDKSDRAFLVYAVLLMTCDFICAMVIDVLLLNKVLSERAYYLHFFCKFNWYIQFDGTLWL